MRKKLKTTIHTGCFICNKPECKGANYHCSWCYKPLKRPLMFKKFCSIKCEKATDKLFNEMLANAQKLFGKENLTRKKKK